MAICRGIGEFFHDSLWPCWWFHACSGIDSSVHRSKRVRVGVEAIRLDNARLSILWRKFYRLGVDLLSKQRLLWKVGPQAVLQTVALTWLTFFSAAERRAKVSTLCVPARFGLARQNVPPEFLSYRLRHPFRSVALETIQYKHIYYFIVILKENRNSSFLKYDVSSVWKAETTSQCLTALVKHCSQQKIHIICHWLTSFIPKSTPFKL